MSMNPQSSRPLHILCERDVGLFSLIQQVISQIPWALAENRIPVVYFRDRCAYWTPGGNRGKSDSVWEYYFEPLFRRYPAAVISEPVCSMINEQFPPWNEHGRYLSEDVWLSHYFGGPRYPETLAIPFEWQDPNWPLRERASRLIYRYINPRDYIREAVDRFYDQHLKGHPVIGVQIRGTDADSKQETRAFRQGMLSLPRYVNEVKLALQSSPAAKIFVATDAQSSLDFMANEFGDRVISYDSLRHQDGNPSGKGPTGALLPAYICGSPGIAAANGEQAIIEWLLLTLCDELIHNGGSLARTVLLCDPLMPHRNTNPAPVDRRPRMLTGLLQRIRRQVRRV